MPAQSGHKETPVSPVQPAHREQKAPPAPQGRQARAVRVPQGSDADRHLLHRHNLTARARPQDRCEPPHVQHSCGVCYEHACRKRRGGSRQAGARTPSVRRRHGHPQRSWAPRVAAQRPSHTEAGRLHAHPHPPSRGALGHDPCSGHDRLRLGGRLYSRAGGAVRTAKAGPRSEGTSRSDGVGSGAGPRT